MNPELLSGIARLAGTDSVEGFMDGVMSVVHRALHAELVYVAVGHGANTRTPRWSRCSPGDRADEVHAQLSTGLMQETLARGETVLTPSAALDPRFLDRASVRRHRIESVLCTPIGSPPLGLLYLQRPARPWSNEERELTELAAHVMHATLARLVVARRLEDEDATAPWRERVRARSLVGVSPALAEVLERVSVCAHTLAPVLLTGPTGTGKSTVARVIHENSRQRGELVTVECTQLQSQRLMADLFGARAGAYTGIQRDSPGLIERARGGTLFLDEVGDLDLEAQGQLLRFLQERTYRWLGDTRDRLAPDVRVVCATHLDLDAARAEGAFRDDLYYRLAVFPIEVPTLSERLDDLPYLAHELVVRAADEYALTALPVSPSAVAHLEARAWPGNVRELDNVLRRGLLWASADRAPAIRSGHLERRDAPPTPPGETLEEATRAFRLRFVRRALEAEGGNRTRAAARLGIHRSSLHDLLKRSPSG